MIREFTRRMQANERRQLEQAAKRPSDATLWRTVRRIGFWLLIIVLCVGLSALLLLLPDPARSVLLVVPSIGMVVCLGVIVLLIVDHWHNAQVERTWRREVLPRFERALHDDLVLVRRVQSSAVIEIWQFEDEGDSYVFDVGSGKLLYLKGQWTELRDDEGPWPNTDFEIVRTARDHLFVDIVVYGEKLEPIRSIDHSEIADYDAWEERDAIIVGKLDEFADSLIRGKRPHPLD
jgi:hypothetical protein